MNFPLTRRVLVTLRYISVVLTVVTTISMRYCLIDGKSIGLYEIKNVIAWQKIPAIDFQNKYEYVDIFAKVIGEERLYQQTEGE